MVESTLDKQTNLKTLVACESGPVRTHNEDSVGVEHGSEHGVPDKGTLLVLADGMGGVGGGEIASRIVTEELPTLYFNSPVRNCVEALVQATKEVNTVVHEASFESHAAKRMGTTVVACAVVNECLITVNVGDSRAYLFHSGVLRQLSRDHSLQRNYFKMFETEDTPSLSHVLTQAIGPLPSVTPHVNICKIVTDDIILLCSDGLTSVVSDADIRELLTTISFDEVNQQLLQLVVERNGDDNVSVALAQIVAARQCKIRESCLPRA